MNRRDRRRAARPAPPSRKEKTARPKGRAVRFDPDRRPIRLRRHRLRREGGGPSSPSPSSRGSCGKVSPVRRTGGNHPLPSSNRSAASAISPFLRPGDPTRLLGADRFGHGLQRPRLGNAREVAGGGGRSRPGHVQPDRHRQCPGLRPCAGSPVVRIAHGVEADPGGGRWWRVFPDPGAEGNAFRPFHGTAGVILVRRPVRMCGRTNAACTSRTVTSSTSSPTPAASLSLRGRHMAGSNAEPHPTHFSRVGRSRRLPKRKQPQAPGCAGRIVD